MIAEYEGYAPERALVVFNEYGSNARRMARQIDRLGVPTEVVTTECDPRRTEEKLVKRARYGDVVFGAGGDGTAHQIGNMMLGEAMAEQELDTLPFVPLRGGNANDVAIMLNGRTEPAVIFRTGQYQAINPIEVVTTAPGELPQARHALGYFSVGATAAASKRLEDIKNTSTRFTRLTGFQQVREAWATWHVVGHSPSFGVQQLATQQEQDVVDLLFLRGDRIAKYGRPHAHLSRAEFEMMISKDVTMKHALIDMLKMQQGKKIGEMLVRTCARIASPSGEELPVQYDGETDSIASGSMLNIRLSTRPYYTLSTRMIS